VFRDASHQCALAELTRDLEARFKQIVDGAVPDAGFTTSLRDLGQPRGRRGERKSMAS